MMLLVLVQLLLGIGQGVRQSCLVSLLSQSVKGAVPWRLILDHIPLRDS